MRRTCGVDAKVTKDDTGAFISVDWHCPYCGEYNAGMYFESNTAPLDGDFEIDRKCEECGKTVTIECSGATELF